MKNKAFRTFMIIFILFLALVAMFILQEYTFSNVNKVSEDTALSLLSDNANQVRRVLDNQIDNLWSGLEILDSSFTNFGDLNSDEAVHYLKNSVQNAYKVKLVTDEGKFIDQNGKEGVIKKTRDLSSLFNDKKKLCILCKEDKKDVIMFGKPIKDVVVENKKIKYIIAYYEIDVFKNLLSVESFAGEGKIRIINSDGLVLLRSENINNEKLVYDFFKLFKPAEFNDDDEIIDLNSFKKSILQGDNRAIHVGFPKRDDMVVSYAKLKYMDWYVTILVDYNSIFGGLDTSLKSIGSSASIATTVIVLLAAGLILFVSIDTSKIRKEKQQLEDFNRSLESAKKITEDALQIAKNANKSKSNFLSNMSHDIRTPMNAIVGFSILLSRDADDPQKVREYTKKISTSSQHLLGLINDILDMSKIESGKTKLNLTEESIANIINEIDTIIRPQVKAKGQNFQIIVHDIINDSIIVDKLRLN